MTVAADATIRISELVASSERPACFPLWFENPSRLVSLLDMLRFYAEKFCHCSSLIAQMFIEIRCGRWPAGSSFSFVGAAIHEVEQDCEDLGLPVTLAQIRRLHTSIDNGVAGANIAQFGHDLMDIQTRMYDELKSKSFFAFSADKARFYVDVNPFGEKVAASFPSSTFDSIEASCCFALGRNTASVFHLMCALESGLSVMAARFSVPSDHTNWHNIIEGIEKAVRSMPNDPARPSDWKDQQEFFSQAASHFMIIKDAWRNYTAHARAKYTDEEAETILINVKGFLQKLAARLHE
jgi:hypothetical protein